VKLKSAANAANVASMDDSLPDLTLEESNDEDSHFKTVLNCKVEGLTGCVILMARDELERSKKSIKMGRGVVYSIQYPPKRQSSRLS
jgi:hypothetical protein